MAWLRWMGRPESSCSAPGGGLFARVPADRRGIEQDGGALQGGETRAFGIPLIPADQRADASHAGVERAKSQIAGREVELLVVRRVVGNVHLAVHPQEPAVRVDHRGAVMVQPRRAPLE